MKQNNIRSIALLSLVLLVSACTSQNLVLAPDTMQEEQLKLENMIGKWCTNRDLTAQTNKDAGISAISNLTRQHWNFSDTGRWQISETGWMQSNYGKWQLEGQNTLVLNKRAADALRYQVNFKNEGQDLYLENKDNKFLVLTRCE